MKKRSLEDTAKTAVVLMKIDTNVVVRIEDNAFVAFLLTFSN